LERKIYLYMCALTVITLLLASSLALWGFYGFFNEEMQDRVRTEAQIAAQSFNFSSDKEGLVNSLDIGSSSSRITLVSPQGEVIFDSRADAGEMENHLNREEISEALGRGTGEAIRVSPTLGKKTFYYAVRLQDGSVIRAAAATNLFAILMEIFPQLFLIAAVVFILCALLAYNLTQKIVAPIYSIDLERPRDDHGYEELAPLLLRLQEQNRQIKEQMDSLAAERDTINAITRNMREGLILLDRDSRILSLNQSAAKFLGLPGKDYQGEHFLILTRDMGLGSSVTEALEGSHRDGFLSVGENHYQYFASPVYEKGTVNGAILLLLDVSEVYHAEKLRKEFSANVSHELKTPLTSISGYAEVIESGMAQDADVKGFAGKIKNEALGLVALINDIIKLSRLDEARDERMFEPVRLMSCVRDAAKRLEQQAREKQVAVIIDGEEAAINGDETMIRELAYNLLENAIKYNVREGRVFINVSSDQIGVKLTVRDTGIGIPKEHRDRVFERFYRVDKSRSKTTAGTGLGLAIVKHIAQYHGAKVSLESEENQGTTITVVFKPTK